MKLAIGTLIVVAMYVYPPIDRTALASFEVRHRVVVHVLATPGRVVVAHTQGPRKVHNWNRLTIRIAGKLAAVADWRGCQLDSARKQILVTINACHDRRILVSTATTGRHRARVFVKLENVRYFQPRRTSPVPAPDSTPVDDADGDSVADVSDNCPGDFNPDQIDEDADGSGDACD